MGSIDADPIDDEIFELARDLYRLFEERDLAAFVMAEEFIPAGDKLLVLGTWRAKLRTTGNPVEARFAHVGQWRDCKLVSLRNYIDSAKVLEAIRGQDA